jgi:hypothetical protein
MTKQKSGCDYCKTNTLDKREKYRHDFIYHEVNGIIDQRLCRKCNLNEKLPEKNWNNEPCGNKLCENCHPEIYSKVKPEGEVRYPCDKCNYKEKLHEIYWSIHTKGEDELMNARHGAVLARLEDFISKLI